MTQHLSSFTLDALPLEALSADEVARARTHLETCERRRGALEAAAAARERFATTVFPRTVGTMRARTRGLRWPRLLPLLLAPALAGAALLFWVRREPEELGVKGAASLRVFARHQDRVFAVREGMPLAAGDQIRFRVTPSGARFVLVASVDGAGKASVYFPFGGDASAPIDPRATAELPGSVELDETAGPERVFVLLSARPLPAADVVAALRALGARGHDAIRAARTLAVPAEAQVSLGFEKAAR